MPEVCPNAEIRPWSASSCWKPWSLIEVVKINRWNFTEISQGLLGFELSSTELSGAASSLLSLIYTSQASGSLLKGWPAKACRNCSMAQTAPVLSFCLLPNRTKILHQNWDSFVRSESAVIWKEQEYKSTTWLPGEKTDLSATAASDQSFVSSITYC